MASGLHQTEEFVALSPSAESYFRAVILFGRNVASYKYALGVSLIELSHDERDLVALEDLAVPFARHLTDHLRRVDTQGTFKTSRFLDACRSFNAGESTEDELREATARLGFVNVIDAFHIVGGGEIPVRFFEDERKQSGGIRLTNQLHELARTQQGANLPHEVEARWRLLETSWHLKIPARALQVAYESDGELLVVNTRANDRIDLTGVRDALNGYQKGRCMYCGTALDIGGSFGAAVHVDHVIPRLLMDRNGGPGNLDGVWNLVLACSSCNLAKSARAPGIGCIQSLHRRNEYLIGSHHPLRETLIAQTGPDAASRRDFLLAAYQDAILLGVWDENCEVREDL